MTTTPLLGTVDRVTGSVHLERVLAATPGEVWDALTDPARLHEWLAPVERGTPAEGHFVLRMNDDETAACTVTTWDPPHELSLTWDYTGEGRSQLSFRISSTDDRARLTIEQTQIPSDPVQYGAGWHAFLDQLAARLSAGTGSSAGCDTDDFMAAYNALHPRYAAIANG